MSNKSRSQSGPTPVPDDTSGSNRRARRKEKAEREKNANAEAGPSRPSSRSQSRPSSIPPKSSETSKRTGKRAATNKDNAFTGGEDFIPFASLDENDAPSTRKGSPPAREWDEGKPKDKGKERERAREGEGGGAGRKRKAEEIDFNDGYANKKERVAAASRKAPWVRDMDWEHCANVAELLHEEVEAFVNYMSPTSEEDELRSLTVSLISGAIKKHYPDAKVLPFGSYETKLYLPLGDIDLVVYSKSMQRFDKQTLLHSLANIMKRSGITDRVTIIAKARVPIVKFVTTHGRFAVDISMNQGNGITTGQMVKRFLQEVPALRSLVLIVKNFLSQRSMNEVFTGGLGSYSIVCLAISFLQMQPKIRRGEINPCRNLGVLVIEFFELYGLRFNQEEVGISLRDGGSYYSKRERGWFDMREPRLLSIEDPGDPTNDISRGSYNFARVRTTLAGAYEIMTAAAFAKATIISARREGRTFRLRARTDPEEMSILASVMGVTQETINHRRVVQEVYDSQVLHRMVGVTPQFSLSARPDANSGASRFPESRSVKSAWGEADMELESDDEARQADKDGEDEEEEETGRYGMESRKEPPKKRQRTDAQTRGATLEAVYTTDEDDEAQSPIVRPVIHLHQDHSDGDGVSEEEAAYDVSNLDIVNQERDGGRPEAANRRSYWLSKAMAVGGDDGGDD